MTLIEICEEIEIPFIDHSGNSKPNKNLNMIKFRFKITGNKNFVNNIKHVLNKYSIIKMLTRVF